MADESKQTGGDAWGDDISDERQAKLEQWLQAWEQETDHGVSRGPFDGVKLTGADVFWLAARTLAGTSEAHVVAEQIERLHRVRDKPQLSLEFLLPGLHLEGADLSQAHLEGAVLVRAHLEGADLRQAHLEGADLSQAHLETAALSGAHLEGADLFRTHLAGAFLFGAHLERAVFVTAHLEGADLRQAHLEGADLSRVHLEGKTFPINDEDYQRIRRSAWKGSTFPATLPPADLRGAFFNSATILEGAVLGDASLSSISVADVRWGDVNLAVVDWSRVAPLGDERRARESVTAMTRAMSDEKAKGKTLSRFERRAAYQRLAIDCRIWFPVAARATRQLATVLRSQGLTDEADRFAYQAQVLQREVLWWQRKWGQWGAQTTLAVLAGYGYLLWRIVAAYGVVLLLFTLLYWLMGVHSFSHEPGWRALWDSFLVSLSAIHGRTTFEQLGAWSLAAWVAAIESVVSIVIEGVFVAMLVQRFFGGR